LVERGFATLAVPERKRVSPTRSRLFSRLIDAGFGVAQARRITENLPEDLSESQLVAWAQSIVREALVCPGSADDIVACGGVYALVGPTGVGKTTTTAKLAARGALAHGAQRIALITTDGYRSRRASSCEASAHPRRRRALHQGRLEPRPGARRAARQTPRADRHRRASQRDRKVAEQLEILSGHRVQRLLLLNAAAQRETLEEVVSVYQPAGLAGAIVTKVDEAARVAAAVDVLMRNRLPVHFITNGQRVPEDIVHASAAHLAHLALPANAAAAEPADEAVDAAMAAQLSAASLVMETAHA